MISQTAEYALRAVVHLAMRPGQHEPASALEISEATRVPVGYLQKILRMLARRKILSAQRGSGGGFALAKVPTAISVLDILRATDTDLARIERCPLGLKGHTSLCSLHRLLDDQIAGIERTFATTTIADLVEGRSPGGNGLGVTSRPLCDPATDGLMPLSVLARPPRAAGAAAPDTAPTTWVPSESDPQASREGAGADGNDGDDDDASVGGRRRQSADPAGGTHPTRQ